MENVSFEPLYKSDAEGLSTEEKFRQEVLNDFYICCSSREASIIARREVLTGKAKFGISGDGKEVAQVALAKVLQNGDFRSGYYRDQTLMFALGTSIEDFFSQLYADQQNDPFSAGRQMVTHFASPLVEGDYWTNHRDSINSASDVSCTAGQVGRALGLGLASVKYRALEMDAGDFSHQGDEVVICTIGDGSTSEGPFWESVNAAAVMQVPVAFCIWDDGYSISVPKEYQTVKSSISDALSGFEATSNGKGISIHRAKAWDYVSLCEVFSHAITKMRVSHQPALIHVDEMTQPLGHSTSGSHERYKSKERLSWEKERDCIAAMAKWIVAVGLASEEELAVVREAAQKYARECRRRAWEKLQGQVEPLRRELVGKLSELHGAGADLGKQVQQVQSLRDPAKSELLTLARRASQQVLLQRPDLAASLQKWCKDKVTDLKKRIGSHLYTEGKWSALKVPVVQPKYSADPEMINGFEILNRYFDHVLQTRQDVFAFGEDVGGLGDVNQGFRGLQEKYGEDRVFDTGIREWTIVGQAIGMAMRGLRPIAEIQYIDYILYAIAPLSDDLASLSYRSGGIQKAPAIIRSRGHRLEGIWHAGSPMGMLVHCLRGIYICVPRNMTQAAGMYNTALQAQDPVLVIECLNAYRLKEPVPENMGHYTVPFGVPEILREGADVTIVTYGACVRPALEAAEQLERFDIEIEVIDVQTLLPFDLEHHCVRSLQKTNHIIFVDEDVEGGASAFMMQQVLEKQGGYKYLDAGPKTITGAEHRPPYGEDGDFVSKPYAEDIFEEVYAMMHETNPGSFPLPQ